jgi:O-antigen/teichoic acid export membrane protein
MSEAEAPSPAKSRSLGSVTIALLIASVFGYGLMILCGRLLGPELNKTFLAFWGVIFGLGSAMAPLEQEVSRLSAEAEVAGRRTGLDAARTVLFGVALALVFGVLQFIPAVNERLFAGHSELAIITLFGGVSYAVLSGFRGLLIGHQKVNAYAGILVVEPTSRIVLAGVFAVAGLADMVPLAIAVAVGTFAWVVFVPAGRKLFDRTERDAGWRPVIGTVGQLMISAALAATIVTGFPPMVTLLAPAGDAAVIGAFFATLTLARFPLIALLPVQSLAVPAVVRMSATPDGRSKLHGWLIKGLTAAVLVGVVGGGLGALVGPWLVKLIYGADFVVAGWVVGALVLSSTLIAATQLLAAVLIARAKAKIVLWTWAATAVLTAAALAWWPADTVTRAVVGLIIGPLAGIAIALTAVWRQGTAE